MAFQAPLFCISLFDNVSQSAYQAKGYGAGKRLLDHQGFGDQKTELTDSNYRDKMSPWKQQIISPELLRIMHSTRI